MPNIFLALLSKSKVTTVLAVAMLKVMSLPCTILTDNAALESSLLRSKRDNAVAIKYISSRNVN
jgi:hypothetical protein